MQKGQRLRGRKRFSLIYQESRGWANGLLVLKVVPNGLDTSRFAFVVGKRIGSAVIRNKVKRRLREVNRLAPIRTGSDIIFIARKGASKADYQRLEWAAKDLLKRARLLHHPTGPSPGPLRHESRPRAFPQTVEPLGANRAPAPERSHGEAGG